MEGNIFWIGLLLLSLTDVISSSHHAEIISTHGADVLSGVHIECNTHDIKVTVSTGGGGPFHGMIYPRGLSKNSSCLAEYTPNPSSNDVVYSLPLRSCNTMNHDVEDGVEFFNTVVVQPHSKLVTSLGRGFHVRCRYQMNNTHHPNAANVPGEKREPLPNCHMKIYKGRMDEHVIAEHVKIGDYLTLAISIDKQDWFGIRVTNCLVRDGLSESEEPLINNDGCPINEEIFGAFDYSADLLSAHVTFPAHKFPLTPSIYYQCNVKLCDKKGGCEPPVCDKTGQNVLTRRKRQSALEEEGDLRVLRLSEEDTRDKSVEVYSGLLVNEVEDEEDPRDDSSSLPSSSRNSDSDFCLSTRKFAVGIAIAGVLLMLAVLLLVTCIVLRRRRRKGANSTTGSSSVYSGPYSNHAYS